MKNRFIAVILSVMMILALGACGGKETKNELRMYDGPYTEPRLIHYMTKLIVEEHTDLKVKMKDEMSEVNMFKELTSATPSCDLMNCYDGTLLTTFLHLDPVDVPEGKSIYEYANDVAMEKYGARMLKPLGHENTYAVAVPQDIADKYKLKTISDLIPVAPELIFGAEHGFFTQEGSMKYGPFTEFYGLNFKDGVPVDIGLKYAAIENGNFQVTEVYSTDGLNKKAKLVILEDDQKFFPEYNGALLVREDIFEKYADAAPNLEEVLNMLSGHLSDEIMTNLTYEVDVEGKTVQEVAKDFLISEGLIASK
ncbi:MAG: glycine/betaine ABC transporter substrate-binding protein [Clostridiales bacterium]|jgi:osmoprotectant transport system substrate-binding protein|nr:glycine/betaine ABC transporter substrate-binding protein [Clostridiales bacterium]